ncbi:MAG: hypothetical protein QGG40_02030 [Myxococcota bacterium]|jgi:hypothetical protein|nr:hypothetical protein [Myxococcota bacterium]
MRRWRSRTAKFSLLAGLFAWMIVSFVAMLHEVVVQHMVCAEHGEVLELDATATASKAGIDRTGPELRTARPDLAQAHGCVFELVVFEDTLNPVLARNVVELSHAGASIPVPLATPLGPPLAYAPKTSPPAAC